MNIEQFALKTNSIKQLSRMVLVIFSGLLLIIILQTVTIMHSSRKAMTVLVPMNLGAPTSVSTDSVSYDYLSLIATSMVSLRFNFTPKSIKNQYQQLENFISPQTYATLTTELQREQTAMTQQNIMSSFAITDVQPDSNSLQVQVKGILTRWVQGAEINSVDAAFLLKFKNENGALILTDWLEQKR